MRPYYSGGVEIVRNWRTWASVTEEFSYRDLCGKGVRVMGVLMTLYEIGINARKPLFGGRILCSYH